MVTGGVKINDVLRKIMRILRSANHLNIERALVSSQERNTTCFSSQLNPRTLLLSSYSLYRCMKVIAITAVGATKITHEARPTKTVFRDETSLPVIFV